MHLVTPESWEVFRLWQTYRGGGLGSGPLPDPGAVLQQPACTMAAFDVLDAAYDLLKPRRS